MLDVGIIELFIKTCGKCLCLYVKVIWIDLVIYFGFSIY